LNKSTTIHDELKAIFIDWPIWFMLGTQDIKLRYRCSSIGPLWISINMAITVCCMGFLYGHLFKINIGEYFPYLTSGIIGWSFISTLILEANNAFIESESYIKNQDSFISLFMMRLFLRNIIIFAHNLLVFIPIIFICNIGVSFKILLLIPGLFIIGFNVITWGTLLSIITTRYRDFNQIIGSFIQIIFFLTPIMWMPNLLPERLQWVVAYNPFHQFLNLIRAPLLNNMINTQTLVIVSLTSILGFMLYTYFLSKFKYRIVFWL
jgi:ABC-type polysaccharide/polyol phosphate export permease